MKKLDSEFIGKREVKGFLFKKIKENDYVYMYEVYAKNDLGSIVAKPHYEVFEKKISKETKTKIGGVDIVFPEQERYPTQADFGIWAFCISSYDKALIKFDDFTETLKQREFFKSKQKLNNGI